MGNDRIEKQIELQAPVSRVWRALTDHREFGEWFRVKLEGSLKRAASMAEVPVDLTASWTGAPMGEASKLVAGKDAGWRGNLTVSAVGGTGLEANGTGNVVSTGNGTLSHSAWRCSSRMPASPSFTCPIAAACPR